jgi:PBSX family phage terminase large subunit
MNLHQKQEQVIKDKSRFKVLNWGRRSGKTTVFAYEALGTALTIPNAHITYYAQTFTDARDIAWNIFLEVFGEAVIKKNETLLEITVRNLKGGNSVVKLRGWESVYQSGKGRGTENDLLLCDEVAFCKEFNEFYEKVLEPTLLTTVGRAIFASTPDGFNDFYELVGKAQNTQGWSYYHATSYDNPANLAEEIERIKNHTVADRFAQEYMADFRKKEGLVYKEFKRERHIYNDDTERQPRSIIKTIAGVDFGYTNPAAVITIDKDFDGTYWVREEWYKRGKNDVQIAEYVSAMRLDEVYPDPESPSAIAEMEKLDINVREVVKNKDSVKHGIDKVRALLLQNKLFVHASCKNLILELETYSYPEKRLNHNEDENPIKENDHALDAMRYALFMDEPINFITQLRSEHRVAQNRSRNRTGE